jgi:RNA polymerase sigma-70 factor (ECF subfamily)
MTASPLTRAVSALPALAGRRRDFEAWLGTVAPKAEWSALNVEDLGLAWLAVQGEATALAELERRLQRIARARSRGDDDFLEEVLQRTRQRLLVGERPRLLAYRGKGSLVQYLKAVVSSVAVDLAREAPSREDSAESRKLLTAAAEEAGVDEQLAHASWRMHFTRAFTEALGTLDAESRTWLRMRYVDGLSTEAVGAAFGVHRTTAMRRIEKAQRALLAETRRRLGTYLELEPRELDSLVRAMRPSLAENLSRLLPRIGDGESP